MLLRKNDDGCGVEYYIYELSKFCDSEIREAFNFKLITNPNFESETVDFVGSLRAALKQLQNSNIKYSTILEVRHEQDIDTIISYKCTIKFYYPNRSEPIETFFSVTRHGAFSFSIRLDVERRNNEKIQKMRSLIEPLEFSFNDCGDKTYYIQGNSYISNNKDLVAFADKYSNFIVSADLFEFMSNADYFFRF